MAAAATGYNVAVLRVRRSLHGLAGMAVYLGLAAACLEAPNGAADAAVGGGGGGGGDASTACDTPSPALADRDVGGAFRSFCAVRAEGRVHCWGENNNGELGNGLFEDSPTPVAVRDGLNAQLDHAVEVVSGVDFSCARMDDSSVICWGGNGNRQLGADVETPTRAAEPVDGLDDAIAVTAHGSHACAIRAGGELACWGRNLDGELGNGQITDSAAVTVVMDDDGQGIEDAVDVSAGRYYTCVARQSGTVACFGWNKIGQVQVPDSMDSCDIPFARTVLHADGKELTGMSRVAAGVNHTCAAGCGGVWCWGAMRCGALGDGGEEGCETVPDADCVVDGTAAPVEVVMSEVPGCEVVQLGVGTSSSCARCGDGGVVCWGHGAGGRLGNGTTMTSNVPVAVTGVSGAVDLAVGVESACALVAPENSVFCWGVGDVGQLGDSIGGKHFSPDPVLVSLPE